MKKVAYLGVKGLPSQTGADRVVEAIVQTVNKSLYHPVVYCSSRLVPEETTLPGVDLKRIPSLPGKHAHATSLFLFSAIHALLFGKYDFVHVHNVEACFILPLLRLRYKVISTSHGSAQARDKWGKAAKLLISLTEYPFVLFSNFITSVSGPLAVYYEKRYKKKVHYLPNGVDEIVQPDTDKARQILADHRLEPGKYIMFAAGRIIPTKGCHFLLEALRGLDSDINVLVVGDATHVPAYQQKLQDLADDRVRFCSFISSKETLFGLISMARFFVFPSTVEAMSMMLLEVASVETPVICSDIPENTAILPEQALFFKSADVGDLREKLQWALNHSQEMRDLAIKARHWVNVHYRWQEIIRKYESLYETISSGS